MNTLQKMEAAADEALAKVAADIDKLPENEKRVRLMKFNVYAQELETLEKAVVASDPADVEFAVCEWLAKGDLDARNAVLLSHAARQYNETETLAKRMGGLGRVASQTAQWAAHTVRAARSGIGNSYRQAEEAATRSARGLGMKIGGKMAAMRGASKASGNQAGAYYGARAGKYGFRAGVGAAGAGAVGGGVYAATRKKG